MTLTPGRRLGPYEIQNPLGSGGMGEVYLARDTRLGRTVAIKVIRPDLSSQTDLKERFEREARAVSSLNHAHICTLFDIGHEDGLDYLVMEHLEGETLSQRLARGPLPWPELFRHAIEIAGALEAAHASGVIHRDLKPGNVMLTSSGAKLLDFGLARLRVQSSPPSELDVASARTEPFEDRTIHGIVRGTVPYMAPEQLEQKAMDARTDIFALGLIVYEMAAGRRAFEGSTPVAIAAAILESEPPPISRARPNTPPALENLVSRCLAKRPENRWRSAYDVGLVLQGIQDTPPTATQSTARMARRARIGWIAATIAGLGMLALGLLLTRSPRSAALDAPIRFTVNAPEGATVSEPYWSHPAISPDGRSVVFMASTAGKPQLWLRPLDAVSARPLPGTEGGMAPFWSPDSRSIAFFADGNLKTTELGRGTPRTICEVAGPSACGSWSRSGTILFAVREAPPGQNGLYRVSASGGAASQVPLRLASGPIAEQGPFFPHFLPDGRRFLIAYVDSTDTIFIGIGVLDASEIETLTNYTPSSRVEYAPPGYLLSVRENTLIAHAFDVASGRIEGEPIPIAENVLSYAGAASFSSSENGVLVYRPSGTAARLLSWFDRTGRTLETIGSPAGYLDPRISPEERRFAVVIEDPRTEIGAVWIYQIPGGNPSRLRPEDIDSLSPIWSPDGRDIVTSMPMDAPPNLMRMSVAGKQTDIIVPKSGQLQIACDWSSDGRVIVYSERDSKDGMDLWTVSVVGDRTPEPLLKTRFHEGDARLTPDSRWMAYISNESQQFEVYVQPFPGPGDRHRVSGSGGFAPRWRGDGKELFYVTPENEVMSVSFDGSADLPLTGIPRPLFRGVSRVQDYDVSKDGQRFLIVHEANASQPPIHVAVHWTAGLAP